MYFQITAVKGEAELLKLPFLEYAFYCLVAMADYFPYQQQFRGLEFKHERNFSDLKIPKKLGMSTLGGIYTYYYIEVDDAMLENLTKKIRSYLSE